MSKKTKITLSILSATFLVIITGCVSFFIWFYYNFEGEQPPKSTYFCFDTYEDVKFLLDKNTDKYQFLITDLKNYDQNIVDSCFVVSSDGLQKNLDDVDKINSFSAIYQTNQKEGLVGIYVKYINVYELEKEQIEMITQNNIGISQMCDFKNYYFDPLSWIHTKDINKDYNYPNFVLNYKQNINQLSFVEYTTNYYGTQLSRTTNLSIMFLYKNEAIFITYGKNERIDCEQTSFQEAYERQIIDYLMDNWQYQ